MSVPAVRGRDCVILLDIAIYIYIYIYNLREFVGTHVILTPGARKWGSDLPKMTSFHDDHLDHADHLASSRIAHFICFLSVKTDLDPPPTPPKARHSSGRPWKSLWEGLEELWESFGSSGGALGGPGRALGGSIYRKTPDQPPQRTLCYISAYK